MTKKKAKISKAKKPKRAQKKTTKKPRPKKALQPKPLKHLPSLIQTVSRLRAPDGCPWDREQTHQSLRQYLIEEAYEVLEILDQISDGSVLKNDQKIRENFREELGDLLMQVLLHSEMTRQVGAFDIEDVARGLNEKLIRRHPHVFGEIKAKNADSALKSWEKQKAIEKAANPHSGILASILDGLPKGLPALQRCARVLERVTKVGFQWNDLVGPLAKVDEELEELKVEIRSCETATNEDAKAALRKKIEHEMGDLFFSLCNVAYLMKVNPEDAFRTTLERFEKRFRHIEKRLKELGKTPEQSNLEEMDVYWNEAKEIERQ